MPNDIHGITSSVVHYIWQIRTVEVYKGAVVPLLEESKETGGFVAGDPTGTASPWHTTLPAKSSVLYLCEGDGGGRLDQYQ